MGEVGKALHKVLEETYTYQIEKLDKLEIVPSRLSGKTFEIMHICFPYSEEFINEVKKYQKKFEPKYTIIHSTVPVGTTRKVAGIHSPIRGVHPKLEEGIKTFVKFLGGPEASEVADFFRRANMKVMLFDEPETTEAMKLFSTEYYRTVIEFAHRVKHYCDKNDLNFHEVYTLSNQTYNEGYKELGHPEFMRPVLQPIMGKIGGHCILPNKEMIDD